MPSFRHHEPGELYVRINVKFPESIDPDVIPMLENALPPRKDMAKFAKKTHVDEVVLEEPNDRQRRSAATNGEDMEVDEEEGGRGGVQCAQRELIRSSVEPSIDWNILPDCRMSFVCHCRCSSRGCRKVRAYPPTPVYPSFRSVHRLV